MARIRTIKPDFWTDEKLTECSLSARLFFIGLWNFADDNGNLTRSAKKLKMQIFPADAIDCEPLLQELIGIDVVTEYEVDGVKYLHIKSFKKHQVINRPSKTAIPQPPFVDAFLQSDDDSVSTHGALDDGREEEGKGKETTTNPNGLVVASDADDQSEKIDKPAKPDCPHQAIIALYHEVLPMCPQVREWTPARATQLRARWNEDERRQDLAYWRKFFQYVAGCDFLVGKAGNTPFFADLEWLTKAANFTKIRERKYENRGER